MKRKKYSTALRRAYVKFRYILQGLAKINKLHLGDEVIRKQGGIGITIQGVANPYWSVIINGDRYDGIHKSELTLKNPIVGRIRRINSTYCFKMSNWFSIDTYQKSLFSKVSGNF